MKIGILMTRPRAEQHSPIMPEVIRRLAGRGARVAAIYPEEGATNLAHVRVEHDLYVLKSVTEMGLSMAGALDAAGAAILNPFPVAAAMRDKIAGTGVLQAAGIPIPETYVGADAREFAPLLEGGALLFKPYRGYQGQGIQLVREARELGHVPAYDGIVYAQRYHRPDGFDRKIYCIGGELFGVMRTWPVRTYEEKLGVPFTLSPELGEIALRCGRAFGIDLFGIDILESHGRPWVVDFCAFPGFKGVPDAAARLAEYIYTAACRVLEGGPVTPFAKEAAA